MKEEVQKEVIQEELKEPQYVTLREKYGCNNCKLHKKKICECNTHYKSISVACDCPKRFAIPKLLVNILAIGILYNVFQKAQQTFQWPLLSIFLTAVAICVLDLLFVWVGKAIRSFCQKLEQDRHKKYEAELEKFKQQKAEKARQEEEARKKQEAKFAEVNEAKELIKQFHEMRKGQSSKERANPFNTKEYKDFLVILDQISSKLVPESFEYLDMKHLFQIHLPEFRNICQDYAKRYLEDILLEDEKDNFEKLLLIFTTRLVKMQEDIQEGSGSNLNIRMKALGTLIKQKRSEQ